MCDSDKFHCTATEGDGHSLAQPRPQGEKKSFLICTEKVGYLWQLCIEFLYISVKSCEQIEKNI